MIACDEKYNIHNRYIPGRQRLCQNFVRGLTHKRHPIPGPLGWGIWDVFCEDLGVVITSSNIGYRTATTLPELNRRLNSQKTPHGSSSWVSHGVSFVGIWVKICLRYNGTALYQICCFSSRMCPKYCCCCNIKYHTLLFANNIHFIRRTIFKFCTSCITLVPHAKFQHDWANDT